MTTSSTRAFTIIEILVTIAIISVMSTIVYAQIASARTKGIDSAKKEQLNTVRTAIQSYVLDTGHPPRNYDCEGATCVPNPLRTTLAIEDTANPDNPTTESGKAYRASMQELVDGKYLAGIPRSPGGAGYSYYDYGPGSTAGGMIGTALDSALPSADGLVGSCRPFATSDFLGIHYLKQLFETFSVATKAYAIHTGGGPDGIGDYLACSYYDPVDELWYESYCPSGATQLCDTSVSQDYCLCNVY